MALSFSACQPIMPQAKLLAPEPVGLRPDAPEYAKHGPYWVGYQSVVIGEETDHPLEGGLWYPALNPQGVKEKITYAIRLKVTGMEVKSPTVVYGHALQDAAVNAAAAPYPLVIFSHGFSTNAPWYSTLIEHYASYGFIVLAPEHVEHFDPEWSELWSASIDRPRDIKQTLDYAEQMTAPDSALAGLIDMQRVAVVGHSYEGLALGAPGWPNMPPTSTFNGVALDAAGTIYVTGDIDNVLYRLAPTQ